MAMKNKIPSKAMQKRIMKTGEVTDADVEQYIKQVGMDTLQGMSLAPEDLKAYLKNITELGNPKPKKKLPSKKKVDSSDSILVVDGSDNVSKVLAEDAAITTQSRAKRATEGLIGLGASAFNKMFPTLGKFMSFIQTTFQQQDRKTRDTDTSVEGYSRQVGRSSVLLTNIIEGQERTNLILQQILGVVGTRNMTSAQPSGAPGPENTNRSGQNQTRTNERTPGPTQNPGPTINSAAAVAALAAVGATAATVGATMSSATNPATPVTSAASVSTTPVTSSAAAPNPTTPVTSAASVSTTPVSNPPAAPNPATPVTSAASVSTTPATNPPARTTILNSTRSDATAAANRVSVEQPSESNIRLLNFKAREIVFKADKFEYPQNAITSVSIASASQNNGFSPMSMPSTTSTTSPVSTASIGSSATSGGATPNSTANISGLQFAPGVDQRISSGAANKTKEIQSAFGKRLMITSGFRDPGRNSRAGGAEGSKHLTGDAVDVQFPGNEQETVSLIKAASEKGVGGIGVYRPGFVHFDIGSKRVWGPDYRAGSIPQWAKPALDEHMGRTSGNATAVPGASQQQSTASPAAPAASPAPSTPSSGAAISRASTADEAATRPSAVSITAPQSSPAVSISNAAQQPSSTSIDPNNPGDVEPPDAALRYARLFGMAA